jgi:hypothetical protein
MKTGFATRPWLIVPMVAGIHLHYAVGYFLDRGVAEITALYFANILFGWTLPYILIAVAITALLPMAINLSPHWVHLCLWPQQFLVFLMMLSAAVAASNGAYPDGTVKPGIFISTDQCFTFWMMAAHFAALIRNSRF